MGPLELHGLKLGDLSVLAPELILVIAAIVLSLLDLLLPKRVSRSLFGWLTLLGIVVSACSVIVSHYATAGGSGFLGWNWGAAEPVQLLNGSWRVDDFASILKLVFLTGTGLIVLMSIGSVREDDIQHPSEYYYLLLPATLGAMVMASSTDLITLFVGLELLSITSYILVGMRKKHLPSNEGAFKYVVLGGISSATILYGMSFLYGISGSTNILEIRGALAQHAGTYSGLLYVAFFLLFAGFGFKVAAAPFHMWAPDAYQGAPTPVAAFLAVVSKGAGFAILFRIVYGLFFNIQISPELPFSSDVFFALTVLAAATMIIGNLVALRQRNFKRLLAFSGIANAGYLMVPIAAQFSITHYSNFQEFVYYLIAYLFMNIGAFAVLMVVERSSGTSELRGFAGLYHRAPWTAAAMVLLVLSLAGLPVTGGFFGKIFILMGALENRLYWLAAVMIATSVVSFYYYFGTVRQMFMRSDTESGDIRIPLPLGIALWICTAASVVMGLFPQVILNGLESIFSVTKNLMLS